MIKIKLFYLIMPWQIDYALLTNSQLKKSKYYLGGDVEITIDTHLNLSSYIVDWDNSELPKEFFIKKYNNLAVLLQDYKHNSIIYDGDENYGLLDMQKIAYGEEFDYYIPMCPDIYFSEHALFYLIESAKLVKNKYFAITTEICKKWDNSWDEITNSRYLNVPYEKWDTIDPFEVHYLSKNSNKDRSLEKVKNNKWAIWFDIYNKAFYEDLCPVHEDWIGYGPWDYYSILLTEGLKNLGIDFQQYVLREEIISDYDTGFLKGKNYTMCYKDFLTIKVGANEQRKAFEDKMVDYMNIGIKKLKEKDILPKDVHIEFVKK